MDFDEIRAYWSYAEAQESRLLRYIDKVYDRLSDEIQGILDRFQRIELSGNLPRREVEILHRKIKEWKESGYTESYQMKLYLHDMENRIRIKGEESLFLYLFAAFTAVHVLIMDKDQESLFKIAQDTYMRNMKTLSQDKITPPSKNEITALLEELPDGTKFRTQVNSYAQYAAQKTAEAIRAAKQQNRSVDKDVEQILRVSRNRLLKKPKSNINHMNHYYGYLDRTMTAVVGYTVMKVFQNSGIKKYKFIAVMDGRTTDACKWLNNKVFNVSDMVLGKNVPPITMSYDGKYIPHPCRSMIQAISTTELIQKSIRSNGSGGQQRSHSYKKLGTVDFHNQLAIESIMKAFMKKYVSSAIEHCLVIAPSGDVYLVYGDEYSVDTTILGDEMKGSINIHNHPNVRTSYTFSYDDDLSSFYEDGTKVMMAFDEKYVYEIQRPEIMPSREKFDSVVQKAYQNRYINLKDNGYLIDNPIEEDIIHIVIKSACKELGITYKRWKNE